jgi:hypothetical protein
MENDACKPNDRATPAADRALTRNRVRVANARARARAAQHVERRLSIGLRIRTVAAAIATLFMGKSHKSTSMRRAR